MLERVGLERGRCDVHGGQQLVVILPHKDQVGAFGYRVKGGETRICEGCIKALYKWAEVLRREQLGRYATAKPKAKAKGKSKSSSPSSGGADA